MSSTKQKGVCFIENYRNQYDVVAIRRKIKLIEGNAKCCHLKKLTCNGTLQQVFICLRPRIPYLPPPHTLYTNILTNIGKGRGGRAKPERRGERQEGREQITKLGWQHQYDLMYARNWLSPVYKTPAAKSLYRSLFRWRHFALTSLSLIFLRCYSKLYLPWTYKEGRLVGFEPSTAV
jgi:hypothetical protein